MQIFHSFSKSIRLFCLLFYLLFMACFFFFRFAPSLPARRGQKKEVKKENRKNCLLGLSKKQDWIDITKAVSARFPVASCHFPFRYNQITFSNVFGKGNSFTFNKVYQFFCVFRGFVYSAFTLLSCRLLIMLGRLVLLVGDVVQVGSTLLCLMHSYSTQVCRRFRFAHG